jgi:lysozyme
MGRQINDAGVSLIKSFESFEANPYLDQAGVATIGYGTTLYLDGTPVTMQDSPIDEPTAAQLLGSLLTNEYCPQVEAVVTVTITDNMFAALVSFTYNEGIGSLKESTVLKCNNSRNWQDAARAFALWNKAKINGALVVDPGLVRRRAAEATLYLS